MYKIDGTVRMKV